MHTQESFPPWLTNPVSLIRLLKSPADPPILSIDPTLSSSAAATTTTTTPPNQLSKIEIATRAWKDPRCEIWKKDEIIGEWVLDVWTKEGSGVPRSSGSSEAGDGKKGKGKGKGKSAQGPLTPALLDERYHNLLSSILTGASTRTSTGSSVKTHTKLPITIPLPRLITSFFTHLLVYPSLSFSTSSLPLLLASALQTFTSIQTNLTRTPHGTSHQSGKAEEWIESLGMGLAWGLRVLGLDRETEASSEHANDAVVEGLKGILEIVKRGLEGGLRANLARRKLTLTSLPPHLPSILLASGPDSPLRSTIVPLLPGLFFPLEVVQSAPTFVPDGATATSWSSITKHLIGPLVEDGPNVTAGKRSLNAEITRFLPPLFSAYVIALKTHRYALHTASHSQPKTKGGAGGEVPLDVWVMAKVREGTLTGCEGSLKLIRSLRVQGVDTSDDARWEAIEGIWTEVDRSGSYFEGEAGWRAAVRETLSMLDEFLDEDASEGAELTTGKREALEVARILIDLDYEAVFDEEAAHGRKTLRAALTSSVSAEQGTAIALLLSILKFHSLTQNLPAFFALLANSIQDSLTLASMKKETQPTFHAIATGAMTSDEVLSALQVALQSSFVGGISAERGWGQIVLNLSERLGKCAVAIASRVDTAPPTKKRKMKEGAAAGNAVGEAARPATDVHEQEYALISRLMHAALVAARGKGSGVESNGSSLEVLDLVRKARTGWQEPFGDDVSAEAIVMAAQERINRAAVELGLEISSPLNGSKRKRGQNHEVAFERLQTVLSQCAPADTSSLQPVLDGAGMSDTLGRAQSSPWSGRLAGIGSEKFVPAVWQLVAHYGLCHLELHGTDDEVRAFATGLMVHPALVRLNGQPGAPEPSAIWSGSHLTSDSGAQRLLHSADFWELSRLRSNMMAVAKDVDQVIPDGAVRARMYLFFGIAPASYVTPSVRAQLGRSASELVRSKPEGEHRGALLYLLKIAREADYLGDSEHLVSVFGTICAIVSGRAPEDQVSITAQLQTEYLRILSRDLKMPSMQALAATILDVVLKATRSVAMKDFASLNLATEVLGAFSSSKAATAARDSIGEKLKQLADLLWNATSAVQAWSPEGTYPASSLLRTAVVLLRADPSAEMKTAIGTFWPNALRATSQVDSQLARNILELQLVLQNPAESPAGASKWLAVWLALRSSPKLEAKSHMALDERFATHLSTFSPESYALVMSLLQDEISTSAHQIGGHTEINRCSMTALGLMMQTVVPGTGKINRANLDAILAGLVTLLDSGDSVIVERSVAVAAIVAKEKAASLASQDVSALLAIALRALRPMSASETRFQYSKPGVLSSIIVITSSLVRQRRDLVVELLPLLMAAYTKILPLFSVPRKAGDGTGRARKRVLEGWPAWLGADQGPAIGMSEAREVARALAGLPGRSTIRTMTENPALSAPGTMVGELAKHAPALLVAYTRAVASPHSSIPLDIRRIMEPGLFAVCEAINTGGKALFGLKGGESSGDAFGLGEGNADAEWEVWGDLWRRWRGRRYTGGG